MASWYGLMQQGASTPEWPYPIRYETVNETDTDVLILGGGIAGCHAAISAAKKGVRVTLVEKGAVTRSGMGGAGVDHWQGACTNPCSGVSPEEFAGATIRALNGFECGIGRYIKAKESWDALLDCERMGVQVRDVNDEFRGAPFRDEATKLMFAYDYKNKHTLRVYGENMKPRLRAELRRLGVSVLDRVTATSLLTEFGKQGNRVIGATGVNVRTGEFHSIRARATVITMARAGRLWLLSTEFHGSATYFDGPGNTGDGIAMGWRAGAEFVMMTGNSDWETNPFRYVPYGMGNCDNTWYGCPIVDARGNDVPWQNRDGQTLATEAERFGPMEGQRLVLASGIIGHPSYETEWPRLTHDLRERIADGHFTLPLYADLPRMSAYERKALFGLMVGQEGKTRVPVYETYTKAGFDPDTDMLMAPVMPPEQYRRDNFWGGYPLSHTTSFVQGGFLVDWDLKTSLDGLYAAGESLYGMGFHSSAAATGRYAGRHAAEYAKVAAQSQVEPKQIEAERRRVYAAVRRDAPGIGWKEFNAGVARVMQDFCGKARRAETLELGLKVLQQMRESEAEQLYAGNPHELGCSLECQSLLALGEIVMKASLARKASCSALNFYRIDYPDTDPPEWRKLLPMKEEDGKTVVGDLPLDYYLRPPFAETFEENYLTHCRL